MRITALTNAMILDGLGSDPFAGTVLICDGRIADVLRAAQPFNPENADIIDLEGASLSPGFIDVHTHSDLHIFHCPEASSAVLQGVTTEVIGNCGCSAYPVSEQSRPAVSRGIFSNVSTEIVWRNLDGYAEAVEAQGTAINLVPLVGHNQVRITVCGSGPVETSQQEAMQQLVREAADQGAFGLSSGLEYAPGIFADKHEIASLAKALGSTDRIYTTHLRDEQNTLLDAVREAIFIAEQADVKLEISHLKVIGKGNSWQLDAALDAIEQAAERGVRVGFDRYPYLAGSTYLAKFLPNEIWEGGMENLLQRLREDRRYWETYLHNRIPQTSRFSGVLITDTGQADRTYQGKSLETIGQEMNRSPEASAVEIILQSRGTACIANFCMTEEETDKVICHPRCVIGSDGAIYRPDGVLGACFPHPRAYGTFARFLRQYVREKRLLSLPEAVRKITSAPALHFGIPDRGVIRHGAIADLAAFHLDKIEDLADYQHPHRCAKGVSHVWVTGEAVLREGKSTGERPGRILRR